jgi:uncharacterized protein
MATAVITGATSGIGLAFAHRFAQERNDLIITGRREKILKDEAGKIQKEYGVKTDLIVGDFNDEDVLNKLIGRINDTDELYALVNNAGFGVSDYFLNVSSDTWNDMEHIHVRVPLLLMHAALEIMKPKKRGIIINVSSLASFYPLPKSGVYSACKLFINRITESLYLEEYSSGIVIKAVCPGFTRTDFHRNMSDTEKEIRNQRIFKWMTPEQIVDETFRKLHKKKVLIIPGRRYRFLKKISSLVPAPLYRRIMIKHRVRDNE